jgi:folate-binding protein YgfZ
MTGVPGDGFGEDYEALRGGMGAVEVGRDVLFVDGPDARSYLQGQCSQDVSGLGPGGSTDALLLAPNGKLDALIRVSATAQGFVIDVDAGFGEAVAARLERFKLRTKVRVEPLGWRCVALRGAAVRAGDAPGQPGGDGDPDPLAVAVEWSGWGGIDLLGPDPALAVPAGARWCKAAAFEACRIEAGVPKMGRELDGRTIAAEAGLVERTVSFTKGCFTGQELVARLDARGSRVARHLCAVVPEPGALGAAALCGAQLLGPDGAPRGEVTSAAWCPAVDGPAGLAYAARPLAVPGPVALRAAGGEGTAGGEVAAELRPLPL